MYLYLWCIGSLLLYDIVKVLFKFGFFCDEFFKLL